MDYQFLIRFLQGRDSGWRIAVPPTMRLNVGIPDFGGLQELTMGIRTRAGMQLNCTLRRVELGVPSPIESAGMNEIQGMLPNLMNKILLAPLSGNSLDVSDINGMFGSLSLGLSGEGSENVTLIWFGDWASGLSTLLTPTGYPAFLTQVGLSTAVAIIPSSNSSGAHLHRGYAMVR